MRTSLQAIAQKAKEHKEYRFQNLYGMLDVIGLTEAWANINKKAAPGVDKETAAEFGKNLGKNIQKIVTELKEKRYKAKLVRRTYIPKEPEKKRPLGILVIADKVVQEAAAEILGAIFEQDFLPCSHGYRPIVGPQQAVKNLTRELQFGKYNYIVEADIRGYFENIQHDLLIKMVNQRVDDGAFTGLIKKWLEAGILEPDGTIIEPITGTPQGGIISPILANIYLHYALDLWFEKAIKPRCEGKAYLCRYADDFIGAFQCKKDAELFYEELGKRLAKFGLEIAKEKTRLISFSKFRINEKTSFEFLGFEYRWGISRKGNAIIKRRTSRKKLRKSLANFKNWCKKSRNKRLWVIFLELNSKLRGYYNYYGVIGNMDGISEFYQQAIKILYKWLNRRSQRKSFVWEGFKKVLKRYRVLKPRITERSYQLKLCLEV
jgi:RNA-directed DNA polymerase